MFISLTVSGDLKRVRIVLRMHAWTYSIDTHKESSPENEAVKMNKTNWIVKNKLAVGMSVISDSIREHTDDQSINMIGLRIQMYANEIYLKRLNRHITSEFRKQKVMATKTPCKQSTAILR